MADPPIIQSDVCNALYAELLAAHKALRHLLAERSMVQGSAMAAVQDNGTLTPELLHMSQLTQMASPMSAQGQSSSLGDAGGGGARQSIAQGCMHLSIYTRWLISVVVAGKSDH